MQVYFSYCILIYVKIALFVSFISNIEGILAIKCVKTTLLCTLYIKIHRGANLLRFAPRAFFIKRCLIIVLSF